MAVSSLAGACLSPAAEKENPKIVAADAEMDKSLKTDVLVVGAGAAGVPAALAAARTGARVILVEEDMMPGGQAVDMYVTAPCGGPQVGIYKEMIEKLRANHNISVHPKGRSTWYLPLSYIQVIFEMLAEQKDKIELICGATAVKAIIAEGSRNRVRGIEIERRDGRRQAIEAGVTVDATGSGIVAVMAGFQSLYGRDKKGSFNEPYGPEVADNKVQQCTWMFISQRIKQGPAMDFSRIRYAPNESGYGWYDKRATDNSKGKDLDSFMKRNAGIYLHWGSAVTCKDTRDPVCIARAQAEAFKLIEPDTRLFMENGYAVHLAPKLGVRESRRILGEHVLTVTDMKSGKMPEDVISVSDYGLDAWGEGLADDENRLPRYGIPLRTLIPKDSEGLLVACKSMSGTHLAMSSYRVQPIMASVGTAAGIASAITVEKKTGLRSIPIKDLQEKLKSCGVLPV